MADRKRIAVWHNLPSGGGKRLLMEQLKHLSQDSDILLYTTTLSPEEFCPLAPYVTEFTQYQISANPHTGLKKAFVRWKQVNEVYRLQKKVAKEISSKQVEVLYVASCQLEHSPSILRFFQGKTAYCCQEGLREFYEKQSQITSLKELVGKLINRPELLRRAWRDKKAVKAADIILTNSQFTKDKLSQWYGVDATIVYPGVDIEKFIPQKNMNGWGESRSFLSVGRLGSAKGHDTVVESIGLLPANYKNLTVVCDQAPQHEVEKLEDLAKKLEVKITIAHRISDIELITLYQTAWALVCAQRKEPFGLVPLEAMACGCPVVGVNEGGLKETIVNEITGYSVSRNPELISNALLEIVSKEAMRNSLRDRAYHKVISEWSWEYTCGQLKNLLFQK